MKKNPIQVNLDADLLKVLRRIPIKVIVMKPRSVGWSSMIQLPKIIPTAMQGMKL
jgi:hypothetical protein